MVLPQDEIAAFSSAPIMCLDPGLERMCSARDFHNKRVSKGQGNLGALGHLFPPALSGHPVTDAAALSL